MSWIFFLFVETIFWNKMPLELTMTLKECDLNVQRNLISIGNLYDTWQGFLYLKRSSIASKNKQDQINLEKSRLKATILQKKYFPSPLEKNCVPTYSSAHINESKVLHDTEDT